MSQAAGANTATITYREACRQGIRDALLADPKTFVMGEDIGRYGGCYAVTKGLLDEFGEERIRDTPLSESAFVGAGIGAALAGMHPIVEIMAVNFSLLALDQIINNAATIPHMSGGQFAVPLVIRMATGGGRRVGAQHSHSLEGWYAHIPGLRILAPAVVEDARYMLAAALADPNPVLIIEHVMLYNIEAALDPAMTCVDIESAKCRREGADVTLVAYGNGLFKALAAAELPTASPRKSSTCGCCDRSTRRRSLPRSPKPGASSSSTRHGKAARSPPRSACASPKRGSSISMPRRAGYAGARCRCLTRRIWKTPPCRSRPKSPRRRAPSCGPPRVARE
jgi:pyruvate/2-oxoglutarate/acetoin dehydrogenase E1 component